MIHTGANIVREMLVALGLGNMPSNPNAHTWPITVAQEPTAPDNAITVYDTTPMPQGRLQPTGKFIDHAGFMVQVRCSDSQQGKIKIDAIMTALMESVKRTTVTVSDKYGTAAYLVTAVTKRSGPNTLGRDEGNQNRFLFTLNCTASIS